MADDDEEYTSTGTEYTYTGTGVEAPAGAGEGAPVADGAAPAAEAKEPTVNDIATQPHDLRALAKAAAKDRRRHLHGEVSVRRAKGHEVRLALEASSTLIGRDKRCDIVVKGDDVSREHARVTRSEEGHFELVDLGSKNGIRVEGVRIARMVLVDGDSFAIGDTHFTIHLHQDAPS